MELIKNVTFNSKDEEIDYWKSKAEEFYDELQSQKHEMDEFIQESKQLENEYDVQLSQNEKTIKDVTTSNNKLKNEIESLRSKLDTLTSENNRLEVKNEELLAEKHEMQNYVRRLEQKNDDLERAHRIVDESIQGFQVALNSAIERNAILESEVDEKETLKERLQRLVDETRDLKQELLVKEREKQPDNDRVRSDTNRVKESETQTTPLKRDTKLLTPLSPASRAVAINLVGDLIRKLGSLERNIDYTSEQHQKKKNPRGGSAVNGFSK